LGIHCVPITWPIGMGKGFKGVYHLHEDRIYLYKGDKAGKLGEIETIDGLDTEAAQAVLGDVRDTFLEEIELVREVAADFDLDDYRAGKLTPVYFGSAINNFGVTNLLDGFVEWAPAPLARETDKREVTPDENKLSGFVFKIQANMDPKHRDRVAFMRVCSGSYKKGMQLYQVRTGKNVRISDAVTFMAAERQQAEEAWPGDIIGLHNHGTIALGDSFTEGESIIFTGIPNFAPELFRRVVLKDPLKSKQLNAGLDQLCEEGATQVYRPLRNNDIVLGAVGVLQFDVVKERLATEYNVACVFEPIDVHTARWVDGSEQELRKLRDKADNRLAVDHSGALVYLASSRVNLSMMEERWPELAFNATREQSF
ncbi:MAG: peptide chain release factor 3, partial [Nevskiales bacterium]